MVPHIHTLEHIFFILISVMFSQVSTAAVTIFKLVKVKFNGWLSARPDTLDGLRKTKLVGPIRYHNFSQFGHQINDTDQQGGSEPGRILNIHEFQSRPHLGDSVPLGVT